MEHVDGETDINTIFYVIDATNINVIQLLLSDDRELWVGTIKPPAQHRATLFAVA